MALSSESEVGQLREEAEANRARLADTVGELRAQVSGTVTDIKDKLSPSAIKTEVHDYVRETKDHLLQRLQTAASENPLRTAAIGAAVAYPVFNLVRSMPAPLLLIGAGLFLSGAGGRKLSQATEGVRSKTMSTFQEASASVAAAQDSVNRGIHDARDFAAEQAKTVLDKTKDGLSGLTRQASDMSQHGQSLMANMAGSVADTASDLTKQARETVGGTWEKNPLLVASAGLAFGAFIAAAFPTTSVEEKVMGEASAAARKKAEDLSGGVLATAQSAIDSTMQAADEQGLSPDGLKSFGDDLTEKAAAVVRRGIDTAIGDETPPSSTGEEVVL